MTKNDRDLSPRFSNDCWLNAERIFWDYEIDIPFLIFQRGRQKRKKTKKSTQNWSQVTSVGRVSKSLIHCIYHHHHQKGMLIVRSSSWGKHQMHTHCARFNWNYANETWTGKRDNSNKSPRKHGKRHRKKRVHWTLWFQYTSKRRPTQKIKRSKKAAYLLKKWKTSSVK